MNDRVAAASSVQVQSIPRYRQLSVAPMLDYTDRLARGFLRLFARDVGLYSEMVTTSALMHGNRDRLLRFHDREQPVILQLGGSDPEELALCARMAEDAGYREVNLNVGCPSDRVQNGRMGACLMAEPERVAECFAAMQSVVRIPVSIKHRLGIDGRDRWEELVDFVRWQVQSGCRHLIVHARIAILQGLSPKENREIPPLRYDWVYALKQLFPGVCIVLNGGVRHVEEVEAHLRQVDGVMIGREAYHNPWILAQCAHRLWGEPLPDRDAILEQYRTFMAEELAAGTPLVQMTRHILGLYHGMPGARAWRQHLSSGLCRTGARLEVIDQALAAMHRHLSPVVK